MSRICRYLEVTSLCFPCPRRRVAAAYPAGKGVFAEFDVPIKSLFPAGKPEWFVIPGPNVGTTRFGPPPSQMPLATCISVVCRR